MLRSVAGAVTLRDSRHRNRSHQRLSQGTTALAGLLNVVAQSMSHHWHADGLNVFGQNHFPPVHQRPCLRGVPQSDASRVLAGCGIIDPILAGSDLPVSGRTAATVMEQVDNALK